MILFYNLMLLFIKPTASAASAKVSGNPSSEEKTRKTDSKKIGNFYFSRKFFIYKMGSSLIIF